MLDFIFNKYKEEKERKNLYGSKILEDLHEWHSLCYNTLYLLKDTNEQAKKFYEFLLA